MRAVRILSAQRAFLAAARPLKLIVSWRLGSVARFLDVRAHLCIHFSMWTGMSGIRPKPRRILPNTRYTLRTLPLSLEDPQALTVPDPDAVGEERFIALAADPTGRVLVTVFAYAEANIRIISARRASPGERKRYERR